MGVQATVVFADLFGSTGVFESLGNARATEAVTQITTWVGKVCTAHGGTVVKFLGDGVLAIFQDSRKAIGAVVDLQRSYQPLLAQMPTSSCMPLRIGLARGDVEFKDDDCYGDAVNIAARLESLADHHASAFHKNGHDATPTEVFEHFVKGEVLQHERAIFEFIGEEK